MAQYNHITTEELASCRKELERRWKSRIVDNKLLEHAWQVAYNIATILYDEFGATQVTVFGSLTEPVVFTKSSDIDIAVGGLADEVYTKASGKIMDIESEFKIDLINLDTTKGLFRERIQQQAIPLRNGEYPILWNTIYQHYNRQVVPKVEEEIYEMNRQNLLLRIHDELMKMDDTLIRIQRGLESIKVLPYQAREFIESTIATDLADIYNGFERIFERIARDVDEYLPRGNRWHKDLINQMANKRTERPPVISKKSFEKLSNLLNFRHKVNNIYRTELKYENTLEHAETIVELFATVSQELNTFSALLKQQSEDD